MGLAILLVTALAAWDASREADRAFSDFAESARASTQKFVQYTHIQKPADLDSLEEKGASVAMLHDHVQNTWILADGLRAPEAVTQKLEAHASDTKWVRLERDTSAELALPRRASVAARVAIDAEPYDAVWNVVTAGRERDREIGAQRRAVLLVLVGSAIVMLFGVWLVREQRREHALSQKLAVAEVTRSLDEKLGRADKIATLGALATGIAHEVSTPLGVIVGRAEQLERRVVGDPGGEKAVAQIFEQAGRIRQIITGFSRLARGETPAFARVLLGDVFDTARGLTRHRFDTANVELIVKRATADEAFAVLGEPLLLEQALVNLLLNACDAGSRHVTLAAESDGDHVRMIVDDDGEGIAPEFAGRAKEPFFTTKPQGTGLGLAIVTEIVRHHRGTLTLAPREGKGTRATIELPTGAPS
jgi:two-component system, NtrC family, sensor kinase